MNKNQRELKFRAWSHKNKKWLNENESYLNLFSITSGLYDVLELEVQQFTGLYDKSAQPIFEGDIISSMVGKFKWCGQVVWDHYGFYINFTDGGGIPIQDGLDWKILGNVFENPELLNKD